MAERFPVEVADRIADGFPRLVTRALAKRGTAYLEQADAELLSGLKKAGFKTWSGPDGTGFMTCECFLLRHANSPQWRKRRAVASTSPLPAAGAT